MDLATRAVTLPSSKKPSGSSTSLDKGGVSSFPAGPSGLAHRRTSPGAPGEEFRSQGDTPSGTTVISAQAEEEVPPRERKYKTPVYVTGVINVRGF